MSKNAKRQLKEIQQRLRDQAAMNSLVEVLRDGIELRDSVVSARQLHDASWLENDEVEEILGELFEGTKDMEEARALVETVARRATAPRTLREMLDVLEEDVLDPDYPIELVEQELREAGLDPEKIAETGRRIARRFVARAKATGGTMRVRAYDVLSQAVEDGVRAGWRRAHKHVDGPPPEAIQEHVEREVMNAICEWFEFE